MDACLTPCNSDDIKFQFDYVSTPIDSNEYVQQVHNLMVTSNNRRRSFSPMARDIFSPGLSPIEFGSGAPNEAKKFDFAVPIGFSKQYKKTSPSNLPKDQQQLLQQQQQQQQQQDLEQIKRKATEKQMSSENSSFELDLSSPTKLESSMETSSRSDTSKNSSFLNHTLSVTLVLKDLGLGKHSEKFARAGIDLEEFLKLKPNELKTLGLGSDDCKAVADMVRELNSMLTSKV